MSVILKNEFRDAVFTLQNEAGRILKEQRSERVAKANQNRFLVDYRPYSFTYVDNSWNFGFVRHSLTLFKIDLFFNASSDRADSKQGDKEKNNFILLKVVAAIAIVAAALLYGFAVQGYNEAYKTSSTTRDLCSKVKNLRSTPDNIRLKEKMEKLLNLQEENDARDLSKWYNFRAASVSVIAGSGAALLCSVPWVMTAATVAIVGGVAFSAYTLAVHWKDKEAAQTNCEKMLKPQPSSGKDSVEEGEVSLLENILLQLDFLDNNLLHYKGKNSSEEGEAESVQNDKSGYAPVPEAQFQQWMNESRASHASLFPQYYHPVQDQCI